jgi:glycosyltransferase involved in cell wall biosynthesis
MCDGIGGLEYLVEDPRVTVVGANGPCHEDFGAWARNRGIAMGANPWIAYIDDDDVWLPNHLSTISSLLSEHPQATMVRTSGQPFSWRHKSSRSKDTVRKIGQPNTTDILTVGMAHTRELFKCTAGWMPQDNHDKLLWNAMIGSGGLPVVTDQVTFEFAR